MKRCIWLLPLVLVSLTGCGQIERMNRMINCSTYAIHENRYAVERSTQVISENAHLVEQSNRAIEENKHHLESLQE